MCSISPGTPIQARNVQDGEPKEAEHHDQEKCAVGGTLSVSSLHVVGGPSGGLSGTSLAWQELAYVLVAMHFIEIVFLL